MCPLLKMLAHKIIAPIRQIKVLIYEGALQHASIVTQDHRKRKIKPEQLWTNVLSPFILTLPIYTCFPTFIINLAPPLSSEVLSLENYMVILTSPPEKLHRRLSYCNQKTEKYTDQRMQKCTFSPHIIVHSTQMSPHWQSHPRTWASGLILPFLTCHFHDFFSCYHFQSSK